MHVSCGSEAIGDRHTLMSPAGYPSRVMRGTSCPSGERGLDGGLPRYKTETFRLFNVRRLMLIRESHMDPNTVVTFLTEHTADWSRITLLTLINPISRFELVPAGSEESTSVIGRVETERQLWLHPKLLVYAILSIVLGLMINELIPGREPGPELVASVVIIFIYWLVSGSVLHLVCLVLRGKGKYLETLSVIIQVSATLYVITGFLAFLAALFLVLPQVADILEKITIFGRVFTEEPVFVFFLIGTILSVIYVPLSMKPVHRFGWGRTVVIALLPLLTVGFAVAIYLQYGLLIEPATPPPPF
jgi:hypothetical protein